MIIIKRITFAYTTRTEVFVLEIPETLLDSIEALLAEKEYSRLIQDAQALSSRYRTNTADGKRLIGGDNDALAYIASRMPATYGAVYTALYHVGACLDNDRPLSLLDAGAGTGAASWAAGTRLELSEITCLEREEAMIKLGSALASRGMGPLRNAVWARHTLGKDNFPYKADLVIASYVLNEMPLSLQLDTAVSLWNSAGMMLLIVEPGTPECYANLMKIRKKLMDAGAHIAAPCPHSSECMLKDDWCHFTCRIPRSRLHKRLKGGQAPFEDEKFMYLAVTRNICDRPEARILRHPRINKGHIGLNICSYSGISNITVSKKDGDKFSKARKAKPGDSIDL